MSRIHSKGIRGRVYGAAAVAVAALTITVFVGGSHLDSAGATTKPKMGKLEVCNLAAANSPSLLGQSFSFTERTASSHVGPFAVDAASKPGASCGGLTSYRLGTYVHIEEAQASGVQISRVTVHAGKTVRTEGGGDGGCSGGGGGVVMQPITARIGTSGTTTVTYTNAIIVPPLCPAIEVCVEPRDSGVQGSFNFNLSSGQWSTSASVNLPSGGGVNCSGDILVPPGQVTVTEASSPAYNVSSIAAIPTGNLVSQNLSKQTATFAVHGGSATTAIFTDSTAITQLAPTSGDASLGHPFTAQLHTNGVSPVTFNVTSSSPAFTVSSSGAVSAPDTLVAGTYLVSGTDSDSVGNRGTWSYALAANGPPPTQTAPMAGTVVAGNPFTSQLHTTGVSPITFTVSSASPAFTVSSSGAVSAPDTLAVGTYTVSGTDIDNLGDTGIWSFTLTET